MIILAVLFAVAGVFLVALDRIVLNSFVEVERSVVASDAVRADSALNLIRDRLTGSASDWAEWTDAYSFMAGTNPHFPRDNITARTFTALDVDFIVFYDYNGVIKWGGRAQGRVRERSRPGTGPRGCAP
jgi:sensor domain CHASE-containing protein